MVVLSPLILYGQVVYGSVSGLVDHIIKAATFWGGTQPWYFFFENMLPTFSIVVILSFVGIVYGIRKRVNAHYFIILWFLLFLILFSVLSHHKEMRHFMLMVPPASMLAALSFEYLKNIRLKKILIVVAVLLIFSATLSNLGRDYYLGHQEKDTCFLKAAEYFNKNTNDPIFTDQSPIVFFYTHKETRFVPSSLAELENIILQEYEDAYLLWFSDDATGKLEGDLENSINFKREFSCPEEPNYKIYKYTPG